MGGLDWGQFEFACAFYGVEDLEACVDALLDLKNHRRPAGAPETEPEYD